MPKIVVGAEVKSVKTFDPKFDSGALAAAKAALAATFRDAAKHALGAPKEGGYFIALSPKVELLKDERKLLGICTWEISVIEHGQRKMFPAMRQAAPAAASLDRINPAKVVQGMVDDVVAGAVKKEVTGILERLPK